MELNEMEKKMLFQVEGDCQAKVLNELYMTVRYSNNSEQREAAESLMAKVRVLSDRECMDLVRDIQKNYRLPHPPRTIGEKIAEARQQSGAEKLKGHDIMGLERFDPEVKHMIVFDVLSYDSPVGDKGDKMRLFLTEAGYQKFLESQERGEVKLKNHAKVSGGHTEQAIQERIEGTRTVKPRRTFSQKPAPKIGLLVDIEAAVRFGKGPGYERWAKVFNLKQLSQAVIYLKEHGDMSYEDLQEKAAAATANFNALSAQIKELESRMTANGELQKQIVNYAKTRAVYVEYRKAGYSKKFRSEHEADILLHQVAKKYFDSMGITKLPSVKSLREEYAGLLEQKRKAYAAYKQARSDMKELHNIKANVDYLLDIPSSQEQRKDKQKSRQ